jgi:hypothetical protein
MMRAFRARFTEDDLAPGLMFIAFAALACMTPAQNDTFWHLRSGQYMWQTRSFLTREPFSYSANGTTLYPHWWLSQLAFYSMYWLAGPFLLTAFAGFCAFAAVAGSWRLMRGPWELRIGLLAWLMIVTASEWSVRPQVVSLALLVLMAHLIVRGRFAWLPVLCVVWANAHAMVVFGVAMSAAVALEAVIWSRAEAKQAIAVAAACAAAPMISPLGWSYWPHALLTISVSRQLQIQEYQMPLAASDLPFWAAVSVLIVVTILNRRTLRSRPRADRILLIASFVLAVAAATAARNVAFFAVIAAPAVSRLWPVRAAALRRPPRPAGAVAWGVALIVLAVSTVAVAAMWRDNGARLGWQPMSPATIEAVRHCPDPIFNQMRDGGPLMWALPSRRVFADSRVDAYPLALLRRSREIDLGGDYSALFRDYGIRCAIATTDSTLGERLARDPSMTIIHSDAQRSVFARLSP